MATVPAPTLSQIDAMLAALRSSVEQDVDKPSTDQAAQTADKLLGAISHIAHAELEKVTVRLERQTPLGKKVEKKILNDEVPPLSHYHEQWLLREIADLRAAIEEKSKTRGYQTQSFKLLDDVNRCWETNTRQRLLCVSMFVIEAARAVMPFKK